uniref:Hepcidin n=1 Tax=Gadus morhua TaxID=8049 RepID=B1P865_GADMO|nr:hepcidin precursor [Gadus morhua]
MKAFSIAVAVTLVLAFVSVLEGATVPLGGQVEEVEEVTRVEEVEESINTPAAERQDLLAGYWMTAGHSRQKRQSHLALCRWCCNCCRNQKGCGFCCKF